MHKEGQTGTRHIPATSPIPGSALLLFCPMLDLDTSCLPQISPFGVKPVTLSWSQRWDVPIHPGALWDSSLVVPRAQGCTGTAMAPSTTVGNELWVPLECEETPPTLTPAWGFAPFQAQNSPSTGAGQGLHFPSAGGSWGTSQANPARYLQGALASKSPWFSCSNPSWQMPKLLESPELVKLNTWKRDAGWQPLKFLTKTSK